jgi:two-component system, sensor histidine kinase and response regulator
VAISHLKFCDVLIKPYGIAVYGWRRKTDLHLRARRLIEPNMTRTAKVLLVDIDPDDYVITRDFLSEAESIRYDLHWEPAYPGALREIASESYDACLVDYGLGQFEGLDLVRELKRNHANLPVILLTGRIDDRILTEAIEAGAADYLVKGEVSAQSLDRVVQRAIQSARDAEARSVVERSGGEMENRLCN